MKTEFKMIDTTRCYKVTADEEIVEIVPRNGYTFTNDELRDHIGDFIELVKVKEPFKEDWMWLVCDESGLLKNLPENRIGCLLYPGTIVGTIILCPKNKIQ